MLAEAPGIAYLHEPFNITRQRSINPTRYRYWFQYIDEKMYEEFSSDFEHILQYDYPFWRNITEEKTVKDITRVCKAQIVSWKYKIQSARPLVKDPIAFFSAERLGETFAMDVVVMVRHPAAFCSSLKLKNWTFDFTHFLEQPELMDRYLKPFQAKIEDAVENEADIIDQAILLWNCIHHTVLAYQQRHPEWMFVKHEVLSSNPADEFRKLYDRLGLVYTKEVESKILISSGSHNPVEQVGDNEFQRNSVQNILNWKTRLTADEIERIKQKTADISPYFYDEDTW